MRRPERTIIEVSGESDVVIAGRRAEALLGEQEFDEGLIQDVVLVVHELASNIVKHAGDGSIQLLLKSDNDKEGIEIQAIDSGPGIADVEQAVIDGYSTVGSMGGGLGAVHRLMDDVVIHSNNPEKPGVRIVATRRGSSPTAKERSPPIEINAATSPQPGHENNGDAFLIEHGENWTLVGVIDGLGHGLAAHRAACTAKQYVQTHSSTPLDNLFAGVDEACRSTRGVVMLLARFDWNDQKVVLGNVGNIAIKVCGPSRPKYLVPHRGFLGGYASAPTIDQWDFNPSHVIVVHTDGISSEWNCDDIIWNDNNPWKSSADRLLQKFSKSTDDATVLVIQGIEK